MVKENGYVQVNCIDVACSLQQLARDYNAFMTGCADMNPMPMFIFALPLNFPPNYAPTLEKSVNKLKGHTELSKIIEVTGLEMRLVEEGLGLVMADDVMCFPMREPMLPVIYDN